MIYKRDDFRPFIQNYFTAANSILHLMTTSIPKDIFCFEAPKPFYDLIFCLFTTIHTVIDENIAPIYAFFEETVVDGVTTIQCIQPFVQFLSFFQVGFIEGVLMSVTHLLHGNQSKEAFQMRSGRIRLQFVICKISWMIS